MNEDLIGLKIEKYDSIAKCISILRKYENEPMSVLKKRILNGEYAISCEYTDDIGLKNIIKCYEELTAANMNVSIFELDGDQTTIELLYNLNETYDSISEEIDSEADE